MVERRDFWKFFLTQKTDGCLMGCSIKGNGKEGPQIVDGYPTGLILNHAYGISDVVEFVDPCDKTGRTIIRLLRLRNPWGRSEFNGAWADDSPEMTTGPHKAMVQQYIDELPPDERFVLGDNDGTFFISFKDWCENFSTLFLNNDFPAAWTGVRFKANWTKSNSGGIPHKYEKDQLERYAQNP